MDSIVSREQLMAGWLESPNDGCDVPASEFTLPIIRLTSLPNVHKSPTNVISLALASLAAAMTSRLRDLVELVGEWERARSKHGSRISCVA